MDTFTVAEGVGKMIIKSQMDFFAANKPDDLAHMEATGSLPNTPYTTLDSNSIMWPIVTIAIYLNIMK